MGFFTTTFTHSRTTTLPLGRCSHPESSATGKPQPTTIEAGHEAALSLLHDPPTIITLNPLVTRFVEVEPATTPSPSPLLVTAHDLTHFQNPQGPLQCPSPRRKCFRITDTIPFLSGWYHARIDYQMTYLSVDDGCHTLVAAPGGVSIDGSWTVFTEGGNDGNGAKELRLLERAEVTSPRIWAPFIKGNLESSHGEMHERFVERWTERLSSQRSEGPAG